MDLRKYKELKAARVITLAKLKDAYSATILKFSPDFGTKAKPEIAALDLKELKAISTELKATQEAVDLLIADLEALP